MTYNVFGWKLSLTHTINQSTIAFYHMFITFANEIYVCYPAFVCRSVRPSVCLSVCLLAPLRYKKLIRR